MKKFCLTTLAFVISSVIWLSAQAVENTAAICNAALDRGLRDNYSLLSDEERFELYQRRLCDAKFSSYQNFRSGASEAGIDIPLAEGFLGLSGSTESKSQKFQENYSQYCSAMYSNKVYRDRFITRSSKVSTDLANNWLKCHKLHVTAWMNANQKGAFIDVTPQDNFSDFTVMVTLNSIRPENVSIKSISPEGNVHCTRSGAPIVPGTTTIDSHEFLMSCSKSPFRAISFAIDTNEGPSNSVRIPANNMKFVEIDDRYQELVERLALLEKEVETVKGTYKVLAAIRVDNGRIVSSTSGVTYNAATGLVVFPNPNNLKFIPVIADLKNQDYMTDKNFIREITHTNQFRVRATALDTGARSDVPTSFTAIIMGY